MTRGLALVTFILGSLLCCTAWADSYTGSVEYGDGLTGADVWDSAVLSWVVDNEANPGLWTYAYSFSVDTKARSHVIIGVAEDFSRDNIRDGTRPGSKLSTFESQGNSTPGIPRSIWGIRSTPSKDAGTYSWTIVSDRAPMWRDFYAKSGKHKGTSAYAYNTGFGSDPPGLAITDGNSGGWVLGPGMTYHELTVLNFATDAFQRIRNVIAPEDETIPHATFVGRHVQVASEHWAYVLDPTGQQIFRPVSVYPHIRSSFADDITPFLDDWMGTPVPQHKIDQAKLLALATIGADYDEDVPVEIHSARELIASRSPDSEIPKHFEGRSTVQFSPVIPDQAMVTRYVSEMTYEPEGQFISVETVDLPKNAFETAITFAPSGVGMRVESSFQTAEFRDLLGVFREGLDGGFIRGSFLAYDDLTFGAFFEDKEWRFEASAHTWESVDFVPLPDVACHDPNEFPYCGDEIPFYYLRVFDVYGYETLNRWCAEGQHNGIRGNCLDYDPATRSCRSWEVEGVRIDKHEILRDYELDCAAGPTPCPPTATNSWDFCTGDPTPEYPWGGGYRLEDAFYSDLEQSNVALVYAHGGDAFHDGYYQIQKEEDIWVRFHGAADDGLGKGRLRYLFLTSCASMNWNHGPKHGEYQNLFSDWMNWHIADGIRAVYGTDGGYGGTDFDGFRFFRYYHLGDTITQAWFNMELQNTPQNVPVAVAYGNTEDEVAATLFDERSFERGRAGTGWIMAVELVTDHLLSPHPHD